MHIDMLGIEDSMLILIMMTFPTNLNAFSVRVPEILVRYAIRGPLKIPLYSGSEE